MRIILIFLWACFTAGIVLCDQVIATEIPDEPTFHKKVISDEAEMWWAAALQMLPSIYTSPARSGRALSGLLKSKLCV